MTGRRQAIGLTVLCLAVLGAGVAVYRVAFPDEEQAIVAPELPQAAKAEPDPRPAPAAPESFEIVEVAGKVEVRRGDAWVAVKEGDRIASGEAIRTGRDGRATLRTGDGDQLFLKERVELEVDQLNQSVTELTLTRGKVRATAGGDTERMQITSGGAVAVGKGGGRFTVYSDPRGAVTVASEEGEVKVLAEGAEVTVLATEFTYVAPGEPPTDPVPIPDEVFVTVAWPAKEIHKPRAKLKGKAAPGSRVSVGGEDVAVGPDGTFVAEVELAEGKNKIDVVAESPDGKTARKEGEIQVDTRGPPVETDTSGMYGADGGGGGKDAPKKEKRSP